MIRSLNLDKTYHFLLIALAFIFPLTVFGGNLIIILICFLWLISGDYKSKLNQIINNKLIIASILFYFIHIVGLIWTEDLEWGLHIVHKMWYFIGLFPILYTLMKKENIRIYISSFLLAISITEIFSYLIWFELIAPFMNATVGNPTPFMSHISYNPILAFAIYLVLHELFFNKKITNLAFSFYSFFAISMSINMFITGGRAGQVGFFVMISVLIFQVLDKQKIKSLFAIFIIIPVIFFSAYQASDLFQKRVNSAIKNTNDFSRTNETSVGLRINFALNSFEVIKKYPIIGVGTGDFPVEYEKINQVKSPTFPNATNPHNMYTLILVQLGLVGLFSLLSIFYYQIKLSFVSSSKFIRDVGFILPVMYLVMMLSDSYLLGHYTTLMFVFFSSFLYKDFEKKS
jgi:O-antigen ligase